MGTKQIPHMKPSQLVKELRKQGFTVDDEGVALKVSSPKGGISVLHKSSIDVPDGHTWPNIVKQLQEIGFTDPEEVKRTQRLARKNLNLGPFKCEDELCGCGREFKYKMHLSRHLQAVAEKKGLREKTGRWVHHEEDKQHQPEITKPKPREEVMKLRTALRSLKKLSAELDELGSMFEPLIEENEELKRKLKKVEDLFGKALDVL